MNCTFDYGLTRVRDLRAVTRLNPKGKTVLTGMEVQGEPMADSKRFWRSFFHRFGISDNVFKYFDYHEVFQRIAGRSRDDTFRYCVERKPNGGATLLAVSAPSRPAVHPEEFLNLVRRYDGQDIRYDLGIVTSAHVPNSGDAEISIGADRFKHRFTLETPIDGFGSPRIYLSLLRLICSNGAVGYAPTFRSEIRTGKEPIYSITRALESYDNGEGYAALRQRFESAQTSWASIYECHKVYRTLAKCHADGELGPTVLNDFHRVTGNLNELYGLANLDALSIKRQRVLPARCRVYDLLNFLSELATHRAKPAASRALQGHLGGLIADEYDMEGTARIGAGVQRLLHPAGRRRAGGVGQLKQSRRVGQRLMQMVIYGWHAFTRAPCTHGARVITCHPIFRRIPKTAAELAFLDDQNVVIVVRPHRAPRGGTEKYDLLRPGCLHDLANDGRQNRRIGLAVLSLSLGAHGGILGFLHPRRRPPDHQDHRGGQQVPARPVVRRLAEHGRG